jgi:hypothetical protein
VTKEFWWSAGHRLLISYKSIPRLSRVLVLCSSILLAYAQPEMTQVDPFVGLTVIPFGDQTFDIATGRTVLLQGGEIKDRVNGIVVTAQFIELQQGVFIDAKNVKATGLFGSFQASQLTIEFESSVVTAEGGVALSKDTTVIHAEHLVYFADTDILRLSGGVVGEFPFIEAKAIILEFSSGTALLVGPYTFKDGPFTLRSTIEDSLLELTSVDIGGISTFEAATEVNAENLDRLEAYLP